MKRESIESIESIVQINILQSIQALEPLTLRPLSKEQIISNKNNYEFLKVVHGTSKRLPELINDTTVYYLADKVSLDKIPPTLSHKDGKYNVLSKERADTKYRAVVGPADFIKDDKLDFFVGNNDKDSKKHLPEAYKKENRLETTVITIPGINLKKFGPVKENPADFERVFVDGKFNGDNYKKNLKDILLFVLKIADLKELSALIIPKIGCGVYVSELEQNDKEKIVEIFGEALKEAIKESNYQGTIVLCLPNSSNGLNPDLNTLGYIH